MKQTKSEKTHRSACHLLPRPHLEQIVDVAEFVAAKRAIASGERLRFAPSCETRTAEDVFTCFNERRIAKMLVADGTLKS